MNTGIIHRHNLAHVEPVMQVPVKIRLRRWLVGFSLLKFCPDIDCHVVQNNDNILYIARTLPPELNPP